MSWSVSAAGMPSDEAAREIDRQFEASGPLEEPEESVRQGARQLIEKALTANTPARQVSVSAYGSQSKWTGDDGDHVSNSLSITIS